ncbi:hypothetical protein [Acidithiobacillus albertensis]|uniref:hypothetical protein n=1 Tax=Acidithiobacillus albertensis TaxID=119978 RepID=UPI000AC85A1F|nr:hypothetical protein [Acidithiobacillus albertensis]
MGHNKSNNADIQDQAKAIAQANINLEEHGAILVIVLVLIFAVTLALLAYLYLNKDNSLIASNLAVQNAAQDATDVGLQQVSQYLQNNDPRISPPSYYYSSMDNVPTSYGSTSISGRPVAPTLKFWNNCTSNNYCFQLPQAVKYGPYLFYVEYVIFPVPSVSPLEGSESVQAPTGYSNGNGILINSYYIVYVHAMNQNGGGLGVTVQSIIQVPG